MCTGLRERLHYSEGEELEEHPSGARLQTGARVDPGQHAGGDTPASHTGTHTGFTRDTHKHRGGDARAHAGKEHTPERTPERTGPSVKEEKTERAPKGTRSPWPRRKERRVLKELGGETQAFKE